MKYEFECPNCGEPFSGYLHGDPRYGKPIVPAASGKGWYCRNCMKAFPHKEEYEVSESKPSTGPISSAAIKVRAGLLESLEQLDKSEVALSVALGRMETRLQRAYEESPDLYTTPWEMTNNNGDPILPTLALKLAEVRLARVNVLTALAHLEH